jgi:hypothetical protein
MKIARLFPLLLLCACSPETPPVAFAKLGWADSKYTWEGKPFTGTAEEHYKNTTQLKLRYGIKDGVYHGLVEEWHPNGNRKTQTHYENGRHEGDNFYWNPDGSLQVHKVWKNDVLISETPGTK